MVKLSGRVLNVFAAALRRRRWAATRALLAAGGAFGLWLRAGLQRLARRLGPAELSLYEDAFAGLTTQALHALTEAGVFDALARGPATAAALAQQCHVRGDMLARLLRFGVTRGWVREVRDVRAWRPQRRADAAAMAAVRYALGPLGAPLVGAATRSMAPFVRYAGSQATTAATAMLGRVLQQGGHGFFHAHATSPWHYFADHPDEGAVFDAAMRTLSSRDVVHVARALRPAQARHVCDLAGGSGGLLSAILTAHPGARGTLLERAGVLPAARATFAAAGQGSRVSLVAGDLFAPLPPGASAYVLRNVLHDWPDAEALAILRGVRAVLAPGAVLLLVETLDAAAPAWIPTLSDVAMAVVTDGGRQRTLAAWQALAHEADLALVGNAPLPQPMRLLVLQAAQLAVRAPGAAATSATPETPAPDDRPRPTT